MKKLLPALAAVVVAVTLSAFTTITDKQHKKTDLHWYVYNASTNTLGTYLGEDDRSAFLADPCDEPTGTDCRRGYAEDELKNPAIPSQGVNNIAAFDENIKRP